MSQQFFYKAMDKNGHVVQGQLSANNVNDLELRLERMELDIIHYRTKKSPRYQVGKVTRPELITFCFHMENLTRAGVPLLEGMSDLRDSLPQSRFREVISTLIESVEGGARLSEAMAEFPDTFDRVFTTLIHTGEETGNLNTVFSHLTETIKWQDEIIAKTKRLFMYPAFLGTVILGATFFLMIYLVPQLITLVKSTGAELPLHTKILIIVSDGFVNYWYIILSLPVLAFMLLKTFMQLSPRFHMTIDYLKLRLWLIGPIIEKLTLARFATFFALMYRSGIAVLDILEICKPLTNNMMIEHALQKVSDNIAEGVSITESFERANLFPPLVLRMVAVGESTGELDSALANVSYFYNREVKESIDKIQILIEPIMIVVLGLLLGWVIMSVLGPIYDTIANFSNVRR